MPGVDIKKDDTVRVISGKDRGREGRVVRVLPREGRVMVDGVALAKKHQRSIGTPRPRQLAAAAAGRDHRCRDVREHLERAGRVLGLRARPPASGIGSKATARFGSAASARRRCHERQDETTTRPRLRVRYRDELVPALKEQLGLINRMQVPRLEKVVVNMGVGEAVKDGRLLDAALEDLATITGQKAVVTKARKSIAGFKLREGMAIGAKVTLRGAYMWEFVDRLVSLALPRIRDFRGLSPTAFDGHGNYTLGVTEQLIFPEIDYDKVVKVTGMDITIVTTATTDDEGRALLAALGFPFAQSAAEAS